MFIFTFLKNKKVKIKTLISTLILLLICACSAKKSPVATTIKTETIEVLPDLISAKLLYENTCAKCHRLYNANEFTAIEWKPILDRMQLQAEITDQDRENIYLYLTTLK